MTGFDETVPTDLDPGDDATAAEQVGDNVVPPQDGPEGHAADQRERDACSTGGAPTPAGAPEFLDADDERPPPT